MRNRQNRTTAPAWEADLAPVAGRFSDDPAARPALILVTAGPIAVHVDVLSRPPSDPAGVARTIEDAIVTAAERVGAPPSEIVVRSGEVARLLADATSLLDTAVRASDELPAIDSLLRELAGSMPLLAAGARVASPETWGGWGLPKDTVAEVFAAAASFHRAAPWRFVTDVQLLEATFPDGHTWTACVLGNGGQEFGLALYERRDDFGAFLDSDDPAEPFAAARGAILSLTFDRATTVPKRMRREIAARGWDVAGRDAYPILLAVNTLGGGVTREHADDLVTLLRLVPVFVERYRDMLTGETEGALPIEWADELTGVRLRYDGYELLTEETLWGPHEVLTPALATGPAAEPGASLVSLGPLDDSDTSSAEEQELAVVERFQTALLTGPKRLGATAARRQAEDARLFVEFLTGYQGIPIRAVSEYDLRVFLYDWYPRKVEGTLKVARALHRAVARFFGFLAEREGIVCEWAQEVLGEREWFELRFEEFPGGVWWDDDVQAWQQEVWDDLDARLMIPHPDLGDGEQWGATMGMTEHVVHHAIQRRWLIWRDEVIRSGTTAPEAVRAALIPRQHAWVRTPLPELNGQAPLDAIREERRARR